MSVTNLTYPTDINTGVYSQMIAKNMISPVIEKIVSRNGAVADKENVPFALYQGSFYKPSQVQKAIGTGPYIQKMTFNSYDVYGNLLSYSQQNGLTTTLTYWDNQTNGQGKKGLVKTKTVDNQTVNYDYKPLVGLTSQTDPNGRATTYQYDTFNRLSAVYDHQNRLLKEFCYSYLGQPIDCNTGTYSGTLSAIAGKSLLDDACINIISRSAPVLAGQTETDTACQQINILPGFSIAPGGTYNGIIQQN